jgi:hypothetical protein
MIIGLQMTFAELTVGYFSTSFLPFWPWPTPVTIKNVIYHLRKFLWFVAIFQRPQTWVTVFWN